MMCFIDGLSLCFKFDNSAAVSLAFGDEETGEMFTHIEKNTLETFKLNLLNSKLCQLSLLDQNGNEYNLICSYFCLEAEIGPIFLSIPIEICKDSLLEMVMIHLGRC